MSRLFRLSLALAAASSLVASPALAATRIVGDGGVTSLVRSGRSLVAGGSFTMLGPAVLRRSTAVAPLGRPGAFRLLPGGLPVADGAGGFWTLVGGPADARAVRTPAGGGAVSGARLGSGFVPFAGFLVGNAVVWVDGHAQAHAPVVAERAVAIDRRTGRILWRGALPCEGAVVPAGDRLVLRCVELLSIGGADEEFDEFPWRVLRVIDGETGRQVARGRVPSSIVDYDDFLGAVVGNRAFYGSIDGLVVASLAGEVVGRVTTVGRVATLAVDSRRIWLGGEFSEVAGQPRRNVAVLGRDLVLGRTLGSQAAPPDALQPTLDGRLLIRTGVTTRVVSATTGRSTRWLSVSEPEGAPAVAGGRAALGVRAGGLVGAGEVRRLARIDPRSGAIAQIDLPGRFDGWQVSGVVANGASLWINLWRDGEERLLRRDAGGRFAVDVGVPSEYELLGARGGRVVGIARGESGPVLDIRSLATGAAASPIALCDDFCFAKPVALADRIAVVVRDVDLVGFDLVTRRELFSLPLEGVDVSSLGGAIVGSDVVVVGAIRRIGGVARFGVARVALARGRVLPWRSPVDRTPRNGDADAFGGRLALCAGERVTRLVSERTGAITRVFGDLVSCTRVVLTSDAVAILERGDEAGIRYRRLR